MGLHLFRRTTNLCRNCLIPIVKYNFTAHFLQFQLPCYVVTFKVSHSLSSLCDGVRSAQIYTNHEVKTFCKTK